MDKPIRIANDHLSAEINPLGAELSRLQDAEGQDYLWNADARYWGKHAPILFPVVGRSHNGHVTTDLGRFPMEKHGFARVSRFDVVSSSEAETTLELRPNDEISLSWSYDFRLCLNFSLEQNTLRQTAYVENLSAHTMPFNFGFHPAFRWPLPNSDGPHTIQRHQGDDPSLVQIHEGQLDLRPLPSPFENGTLEITRKLFENDALIFLNGAGEGLTFAASSGPKLQCRFHNLPDLGLWTAPDAPFLCIEPWTGADAIKDRSDAMADRHNVMHLKSGDVAQFGFHITIER